MLIIAFVVKFPTAGMKQCPLQIHIINLGHMSKEVGHEQMYAAQFLEYLCWYYHWTNTSNQKSLITILHNQGLGSGKVV